MNDDTNYRGEKLTPEEYAVIRKKGTEPAFTGEYVDLKDNGMYVCKACGQELFSSDTKFDSGTGWPSFTAPVEGSVEYHDDNKFLMRRTEVVCGKCGGHLGHVFDDGPKTFTGSKEASGKRYCINSVSLDFQKKKDASDG